MDRLQLVQRIENGMYDPEEGEYIQGLLNVAECAEIIFEDAQIPERRNPFDSVGPALVRAMSLIQLRNALDEIAKVKPSTL